MNALIIYAHPNPHSFNGAVVKDIKEELENKGTTVQVKDLYAMNFNPVLSAEDFKAFYGEGELPQDIKQEQEDIKKANLVIFVAPVWWYTVPAIMKGYFDRVFSMGFAYEYTTTGPKGLLTDKKGLVITTAGADAKIAEVTGMQDALTNSLVNGLLGFCGFAEAKGKTLYAVTTVSDEERKKMLKDVRELVASL